MEKNPTEVLHDFLAGNKRFVAGEQTTYDLREEVKKNAAEQHPDAVILSCIDSRVPVEIVFDKCIGDIFSIRIAGNVVNDDILGSMEFACKAKGSKLLMVLGHTNCGAVVGACDPNTNLGHLNGLVTKIHPAVKEYGDGALETRYDEVGKINVRMGVEQIRANSPILKELEDAGAIKIVGANYDLKTGAVEILEQSPA
ncbi:MAG: carbonic anhydrase [Bacteroidota bacterium]